MKRRRLLLVSDSPDGKSGFARITRDLLKLLRGDPHWEVAVAGYWGIGDPALGVPQFCLGPFGHNITLAPLASACKRWLNDDGVMLFIYDASRATELAMPELMNPRDAPEQAAQEYFLNRKWKLWGYIPIDAAGPTWKLTGVLRETLSKFDRVLAYGPYGAGVLATTLDRPINWMPHGIDTTVWSPKGSKAREWLTYKEHKVTQEDMLLGVVGTNQPRKDWGTTMLALQALPENWKLWAHVDKLVGVWALPALVEDLGLQGRIFFTQDLEDAQMAQLYSACDVTFANGLGEGFGYPIVESMACGTPVVHVDHAGGRDLIPKEFRLNAEWYRLEGAYNFFRPVLSSGAVASLAQHLAADLHGQYSRFAREQALKYDWKQIGPGWLEWFKEGWGER